MDKAKQKIVIVGGTSGIGLATAKLFTARSESVTIVGRDRSKLEKALKRLGPSAEGEITDASDRSALDELFSQIGSFDHLVLVASGGAGAGLFAKIDSEGLRRGFEAKFWTQWNAAQSALPHLASGGSITFITAASSRLANPGTSGLAAINGALDRMVPTLARELAPLRVNAVSPGVIDTEWWADKPSGMFKMMSGKAPLARAGEAHEVADAVAFLVGNSFVTGVVLDVDGGLHLT
jgi:NAD(P)-dependent dehydrogenase (short-subunit alcohol dehydrogenase family)